MSRMRLRGSLTRQRRRRSRRRAGVLAGSSVKSGSLTMTCAIVSAAETMAHVMVKEPDFTLLPANTPARLRDLLRRCLVKDPRNRIRDIGDVRIAIEEMGGRTPEFPDYGIQVCA